MEKKKNPGEVYNDIRNIFKDVTPSLQKAIDEVNTKYPGIKIKYEIKFSERSNKFVVAKTFDGKNIELFWK